jgi:hypothetical protein
LLFVALLLLLLLLILLRCFGFFCIYSLFPCSIVPLFHCSCIVSMFVRVCFLNCGGIVVCVSCHAVHVTQSYSNHSCTSERCTRHNKRCTRHNKWCTRQYTQANVVRPMLTLINGMLVPTDRILTPTKLLLTGWIHR